MRAQRTGSKRLLEKAGVARFRIVKLAAICRLERSNRQQIEQHRSENTPLGDCHRPSGARRHPALFGADFGPRSRVLPQAYRNSPRLDKDGPPREASAMSVASQTDLPKPAAGTAPKRVGVLLVNLGTPDTADARGLRVYLKEFLSDPRVIENQGLFWKLVLNGIILRTRPRRKAVDYRKIWNNEKNESPLKTITRAQSEKLAADIAGDRVVVDWAMRYGNPSIASRIDALTAQGCDRLLVMPLYPQYSAATSATVCDEVFRVLGEKRAQPTLRVTPPSYDDPAYIEALAASI